MEFGFGDGLSGQVVVFIVISKLANSDSAIRVLFTEKIITCFVDWLGLELDTSGKGGHKAGGGEKEASSHRFVCGFILLSLLIII